jgi:hypothetical protein
MPMFAAADANAVLAAVLQITNYPSASSTKIRLGSNLGTATSVMTEISGTLYPAGGSAISWSSPSGQSAANSGAISWQNTSGSPWSILGLEIWDTAGTPLRHLFGAWTSGPIGVISGNTFSVVVAGISVGLV